MAEYKTPSVYIQEIPGFTNSIVEVETALPAFIGYTEKAEQGPKSLFDKPFRISSMFEYLTYFGGPPVTQFDIVDASKIGTAAFALREPGIGADDDADKDSFVAHSRYYLYYSMRLFFDNGGGSCYIVSVGSYGNPIDKGKLLDGLLLLKAQPEPTMVVIPDAMSLARQDAFGVAEQMLLHCSTEQSRVAILDVFAGDSRLNINDPIGKFRDGINNVGLDFGAAYYPWIETSIIETSDVDIGYLTPAAQALVVARLQAFGSSLADSKSTAQLNRFIGDLVPTAAVPATAGSGDTGTTATTTTTTAVATTTTPQVLTATQKAARANAHSALLNIVPFYSQIRDALLEKVNLFPPSGAIAGVYARTDFTRGVFKAPAGTGILSAVKPAIAVTNDDQADLNVPLSGKAVNAIRAIPGSGVMVWGARTLNGNSQDTRYINVRRTMIMLEQSIKNAAEAFMFEPNTATTWVSVESMINNFLMNQWKAGALFGATPAQAFNVAVGLGVTMTANDILDGFMNIMVKVAVVRPAEFIVLTFQQTMPTA